MHLPEDLKDRFELLPAEIEPPDGIVALTQDRAKMMEAMELARSEESAWPEVHFLWPLNPVVDWVNDRMNGNFGRHTAPVLTLHEGLEPGEVVFITSALIPNRKSQPLVHQWFGVVFHDAKFQRVEPFDETRKRARLGLSKLTNAEVDLDTASLEQLLPEVVKQTRAMMKDVHARYRAELQPRLDAQVDRLGALEQRQLAHLEAVYANRSGERAEAERGRERRAIEATFEEFVDWVTDSLTTEDHPFIQIIAALRADV